MTYILSLQVQSKNVITLKQQKPKRRFPALAHALQSYKVADNLQDGCLLSLPGN